MSLAAIVTGIEDKSLLPFYQPQGSECEIFEAAFRRRLPVLLKGPTGCGKTRFVAFMAAKLGLALDTIACHDDLTAADLTGRYLIKNNETIWTDGPLTLFLLFIFIPAIFFHLQEAQKRRKFNWEMVG